MKEAFYNSGLSYDTVKELIDDIDKKYSNRIAFAYTKGRDDVKKSYTDFACDVRKMAVYIAKKYKDEKRIAVICNLSYECVVLVYGIMASGMAAVLLDSPSDNEKLETSVVLEPNGKELIYGALEDIDIKEWNDIALEKENECVIFMTSGTTGKRKVVVMSQEQLLLSFDGAAFHKVVFSYPTTLYVLPLYHMLGTMALTCIMGFGVKICLNQSIKYFQRDIKKYKPDIMECVPLMLEYMYKAVNTQLEKMGKKKQLYRLMKVTNALRRVHIDIRRKVYKPILDELGGNIFAMACGGAALNKEVLYFFDSIGIDIYEGYGMTETSTFVTVNTDRARKLGSVGVAAPYNEIRIKDGEIQIKGRNIFKGYYKDEEASLDIFDGEWLCSGDLGYIDKKGFLYITGRKKNLIILSNGENIIPEEIEAKLQCSDYIDEVIVYEKDGHIHAEIYSEKTAELGENEVEKAIRTYIDEVNANNQMSYYIESYELRDIPFEKTVTMKIKRYNLHNK